jgi:arylsulfatase A-like enzyme
MSATINRRDFLKLAGALGLLSGAAPAALERLSHPVASPQKPNILVIVFDALSAEHLSFFGYPRETTPNLARFAERSIVYRNHQAGGNFTSPGTASLLTGTLPWTHRAFHLHGVIAEEVIHHNIFNVFKDQGYYRTGISHNLLVTSLLHQFGADLDRFHRTRELCLVDDQIADRAFIKDMDVAFWGEWLALRGGDAPPGSIFLSQAHRLMRALHKRQFGRDYNKLFPRGIPNLHNLLFIPEHATTWIMDQLTTMPQPYLAYFHLLPPHEPYTTRADFIDRFKDGWKPEPKPVIRFSQNKPEGLILKDRREYDEYLAYADHEFGVLYDFMLANGVLDNTIVVFTADHGELFERGVIGHVTPVLYQPVVQVPLLISIPGMTTRTDVYSPTSCIDVLPSLLHLTGQPIPAWCEGQVLPAINPSQPDPDRTIFTLEAKSNPKMAPMNKATVAMTKGRYKLINYRGYQNHEDVYELYDMENDPDQLEELYQTQPGLAESLRDELQAKLTDVNQPYI